MPLWTLAALSPRVRIRRAMLCVGGRKSAKTTKCFNFQLYFYERVVVTRKLFTSKLSKSQDLSFFIVYFYTSDTNEWTRSPASSFSSSGWTPLELINFCVSLTITYVKTNYTSCSVSLAIYFLFARFHIAHVYENNNNIPLSLRVVHNNNIHNVEFAQKFPGHCCASDMIPVVGTSCSTYPQCTIKR